MPFTTSLARTIRSINLPRLATDLRRDVPARGSEAAGAIEQLIDAVAKAADDLAKSVDHAADRVHRGATTAADATKDVAAGAKGVAAGAHDAAQDAATTAGETIAGLSAAGGDAVARLGVTAARVAKDLRDLHLDDHVGDVIDRIRHEMPAERVASMVGTLERSLPGTDTDRYDRAYTRGRSRARTAFIGVGLATGVAAGIAGTFLLDPERGAERRAALQSRARRLGKTLNRQVMGTATWAGDRARGIAIERGLLTPSAGGRTVDDAFAAPAPFVSPAPLVPVMDIPATPTAEMDLPAEMDMPAEPTDDALMAVQAGAATASFDDSTFDGSRSDPAD